MCSHEQPWATCHDLRFASPALSQWTVALLSAIPAFALGRRTETGIFCVGSRRTRAASPGLVVASGSATTFGAEICGKMGNLLRLPLWFADVARHRCTAIALAALLDHDGLDYGGEVIVPNYSFIGSATRARPTFRVAFVDDYSGTLLLDPARGTSHRPWQDPGIMPVHLFGQPADMTALRTIAKNMD